MLQLDKRVEKTLLLIEGTITYKRYRLYAVNTDDYPNSKENCIKYYGTTSVYPLDIYLGTDKLPFKVSASAALVIAKIGITSASYEAAALRLKEDYKWDIGATEVREICDYIGDIVLQEDKRLAKQTVQNYNRKELRSERPGRRPKNGFVLYCEMDGAMFNTRKSTESSDANSDGNSKQRKKDSSTWKENKLGVVFRSDDLIETNELDENGFPIMRIGKREYICTTEGVDAFRERLLYIMMKNGLKDASKVVIISDGAIWIGNTKNMYVPNAVRILDLFHLKSSVMRFAQFIFGNNSEKYMPWWGEVCKQLEEGKWREVLARPEVAIYKEKDTPPGVVNLYRYILNNCDAIDYPTYKAEGYFVGSGAVESANKTVLEERMKLAGMQWCLTSAERILALRAKLKSGLWEAEVVPLVTRECSNWPLNKNSVRYRQRIISNSAGYFLSTSSAEHAPRTYLAKKR